MTFEEWIKIGINEGWCGVPVCETHDGLPMSKAEEDEVWDGNDMCIHVIRLYESREQADAVNADFIPYKWRDHYTLSHEK